MHTSKAAGCFSLPASCQTQELHPGTILIQASVLGELSTDGFILYVKLQFSRKCVAREEPRLCYSVTLLENNDLVLYQWKKKIAWRERNIKSFQKLLKIILETMT